MITSIAKLALLSFFALGLIGSSHVWAADSGTTSSGGSSSANSGSSGDKADKSTQENSESADKSKQK